MIPSDQFGNVPRVGVEIEVVRWRGDNKTTKPRGQVCRELVDAGLMDSSLEAPFANNYHQYNCRCGVCTRWEVQDCDPFPVQFTLEYDASLPDIGGEFITSPFAALEWNYHSFFEGWDIITANAERDMKMINRNGGPASPSVHVHASCVNPARYDHEVALSFYQSFAPEIFGFATCTGLDRGMTYRHMDFNPRADRNHMHHRFVNIKPMQDRMLGTVSGPHTELRVWEAEFNDPDYIRGALFISAGLTQLAANATIANKMVAYTVMSDRTLPDVSYVSPDCNPILGEAREEYFEILFEALSTATFIAHDDFAYNAVRNMFEKTRRFLNV